MAYPINPNMYSGVIYAYPATIPHSAANTIVPNTTSNNVVYSGLAGNYPGSLENQTITNPGELEHRLRYAQDTPRDLVVDDITLPNGTRLLGVISAKAITYGNANDTEAKVNILGNSNAPNPENTINPNMTSPAGSPYSGNITYSGPAAKYPGSLTGKLIGYPEVEKERLADLQKPDTKYRVIGDYKLPSGGRVTAFVDEKNIKYYDASSGADLTNINVLG